MALALFAGNLKHAALSEQELLPSGEETDATIGTLTGNWPHSQASAGALGSGSRSATGSVQSGSCARSSTQQTESDSESDASSADFEDEAAAPVSVARDSESERETPLQELLQNYLERVRHARFRTGAARQCASNSATVLLSVDELVQLRVEPELARLVLAVRHKWSALLLRRLRQPGKSASAQDEQLLRAIITVLTNEEQALGLQQPAGVGQRPKPMNASIVNLEDGSHTGSAVNVNSAYATRLEPATASAVSPSSSPQPFDSESLEHTLRTDELCSFAASRFHQPPRRAALGPRLCASAAGSASGSRLNVDEPEPVSGLSPLVTSLALEQQKTRARSLDLGDSAHLIASSSTSTTTRARLDSSPSALEQTLTSAQIHLQQHQQQYYTSTIATSAAAAAAATATGSSDAAALAFSGARRASAGALQVHQSSSSSSPIAIGAGDRAAYALCDALFGPGTGTAGVELAHADSGSGTRSGAGSALPLPTPSPLRVSSYAEESPRAAAAGEGAGAQGVCAGSGGVDTRYFVLKSQTEQLLDVSYSCLLWPVKAHTARLLRAAAKARVHVLYSTVYCTSLEQPK